MVPNSSSMRCSAPGLSRALGADVVPTLAAVAERRLPVIAVDVPSGLMGDTGESLGAMAADCTVTFTRKKPGHVLLPGRELCGATVVADIGTPAGVLERIAVDTWENRPRALAASNCRSCEPAATNIRAATPCSAADTP